MADGKWATLAQARNLRQSYRVAPLAAVCVFLLTVFSAVAAGPWYVSPGGSGDCTAGNPCGSIQQAVDKASPGDTIEVAGGTYIETLVITKSVVVEGGYAADFSSRDVSGNTTTIDANGAGSVISVTMGCTPTIDGFTITGGTGTSKAGIVRGGGVFIDGAAGTLRDNTVYDNVAYRGGGIVVHRATDVVTIQGGKVISNAATDYGGGVRVYGSEVEIVGVEVFSNTSSYAGGGLAITGAPLVTMTQLSVMGNQSAKYGGGAYVSGGSVFISNSTFLSNTLYDVGNSIGGGLYFVSVASPRLENVEVGNNQAYRGGGVYYNGTSGQIINATIVSNTAGLGGGGLYLNGASPSVEGGEVSRNRATDATWGRGGGVYIVSGLTPATVSISGTRIMSNTTPAASSYHRGGGMYVYSATVVLLTNVSVTGNSSYDGGGVHIRDRVSLSMTESTINENQAANAGAGIYAQTGSLIINGGELGDNTASGSGGGLYVMDASLEISDTLVTTNTASVTSGYGGGVYMDAASSASSLTNLVVRGNRSYNGGGLYLKSSSPTLRGLTIITNTADAYGGGLCLAYSASAYVTGSQVLDNWAETGGGGIRILSSSPVLEGIAVSGNGAGWWGGGIQLYSAPSVTITAISVLTNTSAHDGGGLYIRESAATINGGQFRANRASSGGGIFVRDSTSVVVSGAIVYSNTATSLGGGVFSVSSSPSFGGGEISENRVITAAGGSGGGVYVDGGSPVLNGTVVMSNSTSLGSGNYGGGLYMTGVSAPTVLTAPIIRGNRSFWGGGMYARGSTAALTVRGGEVADNEAAYVGGGIRAREQPLTLEGVVVRDNTAVYGGGIALYNSSASTVTGCTFISNTATLWGGAMHLWNLPVTVRNSDVRSNAVLSASQGLAGGLFVRGATATVISNTFAENRAGASGAEAGAIDVTESGALALDANTIFVDPNGGTACGGVCVDTGARLTATNNLIFNDSALRGIRVENATSQAHVVNNTLIGNMGGDTAIAVVDATATIRNNVVISHTTGILGGGSFVATLSNNDVWNNGLNYSGVTTGTDYISLDPGFGSATDYHLTGTSPCINAGTWADAPRTDHDGQPRSDCVPDVGAYESTEGQSRCKDVYLPVIMKNY